MPFGRDFTLLYPGAATLLALRVAGFSGKHSAGAVAPLARHGGHAARRKAVPAHRHHSNLWWRVYHRLSSPRSAQPAHSDILQRRATAQFFHIYARIIIFHSRAALWWLWIHCLKACTRNASCVPIGNAARDRVTVRTWGRCRIFDIVFFSSPHFGVYWTQW